VRSKSEAVESKLEEAVQRSEAQFRLLFESMDLGYILVDVIRDEHDVAVDLLYVEANPAAVRMTGAALVGRRTREISPDFEPHWFETFGRVARTGVGERHELTAAPLDVWYDFYVFKVGEPGTWRVAAVYQDVTLRKRAEAALREDTSRQAFLLAVTDAIRPLVDPNAVQAAATRLLADQLATARAFYGESHDQNGSFTDHSDDQRESAVSVSGVYRFDEFPAIKARLRAGEILVVNDMLAAPDISPEVGERFASLGVRAQIAVPLVKAGELVAALIVTQPSARNWTAFEVSLVQETAERTWSAVTRARSEKALENTDQIRTLFRQLVTIQEEERRRISRDIHDQLGQQMTALRLNLEALALQVAPDPSLADQVEEAGKLAEELDHSLDYLTWQLRPATLDHLGLPDALGNLVSSWSERFQVAADYNTADVAGLRLPSDAESNLYRLAQEALHNVYKHADAKRVRVSLTHCDGRVVLMVTDDGRGFDPAKLGPADAGLGLVNMRERAALAGGEFRLESSPGTGTTVSVELRRVG